MLNQMSDGSAASQSSYAPIYSQRTALGFLVN